MATTTMIVSAAGTNILVTVASAVQGVSSLAATAGQGISVSSATGAITIAGINASDAVRGVAIFPASDFDNANGAIGIKGKPTTKGDLWSYGTTKLRFAIGDNGQTLKADSSETAGLKWETDRIFAYKATDQALTSETTLQDDNDLDVTVEANTEYMLSFHLVGGQAGANANLKLGISAPSLDSDLNFWGMHYSNTTGVHGNLNQKVNATTEVLLNSDTVWDDIGADHFVDGSGVLSIGGSGGDFKLKWAQKTTNAGATTLYAGSYMILDKIY
jgi:hypothetical protein